MIVNAYEMELRKNPDVTVRDARIYISKLLGIGQRTVSNVISEYNSKKTVTSPCRNRTRTSFKEKFDDIQMNAVHCMYIHFGSIKQYPHWTKY